ncbi:hypothetical protein GCM10027344_15920 [Spelaeicoccus albus]|uniref:Anti-anti-sigma regulatory factor n=1 Tax=Spelaeicoccus albus TaxID=1280376 RepID=A0A7Z0D4K9_9MICO|nr:anti-anti-sigma regulatory factor [Spelaeicoccus albus]
MKSALNILIRADIHPGPVTLDVQGNLSAESYPQLVRVVERAAALDGCVAITVDVVGCDHVDADARHSLERYIADRNSDARDGVVVNLAGTGEPGGGKSSLHAVATTDSAL